MRTRGPAEVSLDIGPYRFATRIAVGGMAEVFRALRKQSAGADRAVVIKRMLPHLLEDPSWRAMFEHEARVGARIRHDNVVEVLESLWLDGVPHLVLEYVLGVDLRRLSAYLASRRESLPVPLALWLGTELLAGLSAVHRATDEAGMPLEVVHRDVSPSNVFLSVHGHVKLGDLGIAQTLAARRSPDALTAAASLPVTPPPAFGASRPARAQGKLSFLAPEQVEGEPGDQRSDVFAAAALVAGLLLGRPLFAAPTDIGVLLAIRDAELGPLRAIERSLPEGLLPILRSALAAAPAERTPDAATLRAALLPFAGVEGMAPRKELGRLVVAAMDAGELSVGSDRESLARTVESNAARGPLHEVRDGDRVLVLPRRAALGETSETYRLAEGGLLRALARALLRRESGVLLCELGETQKEIHLREGVASAVRSNLVEELLGEHLVKNGMLRRTQLEVALAAMPRHGGRLGESLVALAMIEPLVLVRQMGSLARAKVLDVFTWGGGRALLYRDAEVMEPGEGAFPVGVSPLELLEAGAARRIAAGLEPLERSPQTLVLASARAPAELGLGEEQRAILASVRAPRAVGELLRSGASLASIRVLLELELLEVREAEDEGPRR